MNLDHICKIVDYQLIESRNRPLNPTEILILQGVWQYRTYTQIAMEAGYSPGYFTNVVAPELYQRLSKTIGQRVTKRNCRELLESYYGNDFSLTKQVPRTQRGSKVDRPSQTKARDDKGQNVPHYPSGSVPLNSPFYLERSPELQIRPEIKKPGALIRIKAPREMGKTSLLIRSLHYAESLGYRTVCLNLEQVEESILNDLERFLRWLCASIARQLQQKPQLNEYWDRDLGSKVSSTLYFQDYILESIDTPLVLALDEVNQIFEHHSVARDFLPLLRSWYEEGKRLPIWQKLRLIVVHSTEIYAPLQLNQSPFNVGLPIQLDDFNLEQIHQLVGRYGLRWTDKETKRLMLLVGGHPALVNLALYHLSREEITLELLLKTAADPIGIYTHHLQRHWVTLERQPELFQALNKVVNASEPVALDPIQAHKLSSMGLIKIIDGKAIARCQLYRQYFTNKI